MSEPAGIWLRVSGSGQDEQSQLPDCTKHCTDHDYEVRKVYTVHGKSAYHGAQDPDWQKVIADLQAGIIRVVVIWKVDRLDRRNVLHAVPMVNAALGAGGRIEFATQPYIDLTTMPGRMAFANLCEMAHEESRVKSDRITSKHEMIRSNGALVGRPPWGYVSAGERYAREIVPTEEGRIYIPQIFQRVIDGESLATVAAWLAGETGRPWWPRTIGGIIRCPTYAGRRCQQDPRTKKYGKTLLRCEALVPADVWKRANDNLDARPGRGKGGAAKRERAMLAEVVFCGVCAGPMYRITPANKRKDGSVQKTDYYRCSGKGPIRKGCGVMVRCENLDALVNDAMADMDKPIMETRFIPGHNHDAEIEDVRFEIKQLGTLDLPDDEYDRRLAELRAERDRLASLPSVPDSYEQVDTGQTYAGKWAGLGMAERGSWLRSAGVRVSAEKFSGEDDFFPFPDPDGRVVQFTGNGLLVTVHLAGIEAA